MNRIVLTVATMAALTAGAVALTGSSHAAATAAPRLNEVIVPAPLVRVHVAPAPIVVAAPAPAPVTTTTAPAPVVAAPASTPVTTPAPAPAPAPASVTLAPVPMPAQGVPTESQTCFVTWTGPQVDGGTGQPVQGQYGGNCATANAMAALHPGAVVTIRTDGMNTTTAT